MNTTSSPSSRRNLLLWLAFGLLLLGEGGRRLASGDFHGWTILFPVALLVAGGSALLSVALAVRARRQPTR